MSRKQYTDMGNVHEVPLYKISIGERQRKDLGEMQTLVFSIEQHGLLFPIIVRPRADGRFDLVAGERRVTAYKTLKRETIPALYVTESLDDITMKELELEENILRTQLTWVEEVQALEEIDTLYKNKYGQALGQRFGRPRPWGQKDTAEQLGISESKLSQDLLLCQGMKDFPELAEIRGRKDAMRKLRRLTHGARRNKDTYEHAAKECFLYGEYREAEIIDDDSVDFFFTDVTNVDILPVVQEASRCMSPTAQGLIFFPLEKIGILHSALTQEGLLYEERPYIWYIVGEEEYQVFCWFAKHLKQPTGNFKHHLQNRRDKNEVHTLAKPYNLCYKLLDFFTLPGSFIYDPLSYGMGLVKACLDHRRNVRAFCPNKVVHDQLILGLEVID